MKKNGRFYYMIKKKPNTPKKISMSQRQAQVLEYTVLGHRHEDIAEQLGIGLTTLYRDLSALKEKHGLVHEEIFVSMTSNLISSIRQHFNEADTLLSEAYTEFVEYKNNKYNDRPKDWSDLSPNDQKEILQLKERKFLRLEESYLKMQNQYNYSVKQVVTLFKSLNLYAPDININTGDTSNLTVIFSEGLKDKKSNKKKIKEVNPNGSK